MNSESLTLLSGRMNRRLHRGGSEGWETAKVLWGAGGDKAQLICGSSTIGQTVGLRGVSLGRGP